MVMMPSTSIQENGDFGNRHAWYCYWSAVYRQMRGKLPGIIGGHAVCETPIERAVGVRVQGHRLQVGDVICCEGAPLPNGLPGEPTRKEVIRTQHIRLGEQRVTWKRQDDGSEMTGICSQIVSYTVYAGPSASRNDDVPF